MGGYVGPSVRPEVIMVIPPFICRVSVSRSGGALSVLVNGWGGN